MVCLKKHRLRSSAKFYKLSVTLGISYFTADILNIHFYVKRRIWALTRYYGQVTEKNRNMMKKKRNSRDCGDGFTGVMG